MKISELRKGDRAEMKNVGTVEVLGVARNYIRLKASGMFLKIQFACNAAPLKDLGITVLPKI